MRVELTLMCLLKNYPPADSKDLEFLNSYLKDEDLSGKKSSRQINIERIADGNSKFFDAQYRKQ